MSQGRERFATLVAAGDRCELGRGALEIARIAYPDLDPDVHLRRLDELAAAVRPRVASDQPPAEAVGVVVSYLFDECGFRGNADDYYDPRNSFLNDVLERRTGIPISLSVLLMEVCSRLGLALEGVGFPGHFLVRLPGPTGALLLDPFCGGRIVGHDEMLARLRALHAAGGPADSELRRVLPQALQSARPLAILERMLGNLLRIYLEREDHLHALRSVDLLLVLRPDGAEHLRIRGLLHEQLECFASALEDLRRYLELAPEASAAAEVRKHVAHLASTAAATILH